MRPDKAHAAVAQAKAKGILVVGPCEMADETCQGRIEGHHDDYDKPLEVRWLCKRHHGIVHRGRPGRKSPFTEEIAFKLEKETIRELQRLAGEGDRTFTQEMRRAIRLHLLAHQLQETKLDAAKEEGATA